MRRAATSRRRCSRSARACARPARAASETEPLEDFLAERRRAGSCSTSRYDEPTRQTGYAAVDAPAHPPLHDPRRRGRRSGTASSRVAATGARPARPCSIDPGQPAGRTSTRRDDALASALVPRAGPARARRTGARRPPGDRMKLTVNGVEHEIESPRAHAAAPRPARGARDHEPEGRLPAGRLRHLHRARRRRAAPLVPAARSPRSTARRSRRSRASARPSSSRPSRRRSTSTTARSAASARPGSCSRRTRCSSARRSRTATRSRRRSPATSAAAPAT